MDEKRCIFHVPNYIEPTGLSGSSIRPYKMLQAFEACGFRVDFVMGYGRERKSQIKAIEDNIKKGIKYDFMYAESSTMPTLLTEKDHIPRYPRLDFHFFDFCRKNGIKIGLFYRDVYWKFPTYKNSVSFVKRCFSIPMYRYDMVKYSKLLDVLYLPSKKMRSYADVVDSFYELPPGCELDTEFIQAKKGRLDEKKDGAIELFYVGGIGELYDLTSLLKVVNMLENVRLTICCRKDEWLERKVVYEKYLNTRVNIIHKSGRELNEYYMKADICMLFFNSEGYRNFAMPIKLFEYLAHMTPIIATKGSAAGTFVEENNIGWNIGYSISELKQLLCELTNNNDLLRKQQENMESVLIKNTWKARAEKVISDLSK